MTTTPGMSSFHRGRRLRRHRALRDLVAETQVHARQLIVPHFVLPTDEDEDAIEAMPGVARLGVQTLVRRVEADRSLGLDSILLFGTPAPGTKETTGRSAWDPQGTIPVAVRALRAALGHDIVIMTDVCLCAYTTHGHCGVLRSDGSVDNDASVEVLTRVACAHADAGADVIAPSDMMDGRVGAIRSGLDEAGFTERAIMSYAVKYASAYYGPFREAAGSAPHGGDRTGYQMDPRNLREGLVEARADEAEGADLLMVKPALPCLDVVHAVRAITERPLVAYNVSGEYAMVKAAAAAGWIDESAVVRENLTAIVRAGADAVISYHARDAVQGRWL